MANLKVVGWGPFPVPGEKSRLRRLEKDVNELLAASSGVATDDPGSAQTPPMPRDPQPTPAESQNNPDETAQNDDREVELSGRGWEELGERKIFFEGQEGADVAQLQQSLASFGFLREASVSGKFDTDTKNALIEFQHKFGIYVDGVAGSVTAKVLRFLGAIGYQPDAIPVSDDVLVLIQRVTRSQKFGIALIGKSAIIERPGSGQVDARLKMVNRAARELVDVLNDHPFLQGAEFPEGYNPERAVQLADSIHAELVIYLDVLDSPEVGPGVATYFYRAGESDSAIGTPLAECIHDELIRVPTVRDRGCTGEDSPLLQGPNAPTVRVELGNLSDPDDRARLGDRGNIRQLANAIMLGISRLYDLELPNPTTVTLR